MNTAKGNWKNKNNGEREVNLPDIKAYNGVTMNQTMFVKELEIYQ